MSLEHCVLEAAKSWFQNKFTSTASVCVKPVMGWIFGVRVVIVQKWGTVVWPCHLERQQDQKSVSNQHILIPRSFQLTSSSCCSIFHYLGLKKKLRMELFEYTHGKEMLYFQCCFYVFGVKRTFQGFRRRAETSDVATWRAAPSSARLNNN